MDKCLLCSHKVMATQQENSSRTIYNCASCGVYVVSDLATKAVKQNVNQVRAYLQHRRFAKKSDTVFISFNNAKVDKGYLQLTVDQILDEFPKNFTEQMYKSLINLTLISHYPGEEIRVDSLDFSPVFYLSAVNFDALSFVIKAMAKTELIEVNYYGASFFPCGITVGPQGWDLAVQLSKRKSETGSSRVLQLHGLTEKEDADSLRQAAQKAARECGMKLISGDKLSGAGSLSNEIAALIKTSAYVFIDITDAKPEIFFALGYAKALGTPAFLTCSGAKKEEVRAFTGGIGVTYWSEAKQMHDEFYNFLKAAE
ncbi:MAG: hypothetical protein FWE32_04015 [Oscillospiraceae bacterium]|nr:hypothetical protein [Oscillospiraceae bacterium]